MYPRRLLRLLWLDLSGWCEQADNQEPFGRIWLHSPGTCPEFYWYMCSIGCTQKKTKGEVTIHGSHGDNHNEILINRNTLYPGLAARHADHGRVLCTFSHRVLQKLLNNIKSEVPFPPPSICPRFPPSPVPFVRIVVPVGKMPRSRRPVTSQSSRPSTAADDYAFSPPVTASSFTSDNPQPLPAALHPHAHYHHFYTDDRSTLDGVTEEEEEEEEESDAEDVFAYLPPTTADAQRERQQEQQQQQFSEQTFQQPYQYDQLQSLPSPQSIAVPPPVATVYLSAESPPETGSSCDYIPGGVDSLRLRPINYSRPSKESIPPYNSSPALPSPVLDFKRPLSSPSPQLSASVFSPLPGPSQEPVASTSASYFPGIAFDNPYQLAQSNYAEARRRYRGSHAPSTQGSGYTNSTGRQNINARGLSRAIHGRSGSAKEDSDRDTIATTVEDASLSKFTSDINTIDLISRGLEHGSADWGIRDGSVKLISSIPIVPYFPIKSFFF